MRSPSAPTLFQSGFDSPSRSASIRNTSPLSCDREARPPFSNGFDDPVAAPGRTGASACRGGAAAHLSLTLLQPRTISNPMDRNSTPPQTTAPVEVTVLSHPEARFVARVTDCSAARLELT